VTDAYIDDTKNPGDDAGNIFRVIPIDQDPPPGGLVPAGNAGSAERFFDVTQEYTDEMVLDRLAFQEKLPVTRHDKGFLGCFFFPHSVPELLPFKGDNRSRTSFPVVPDFRAPASRRTLTGSSPASGFVNPQQIGETPIEFFFAFWFLARGGFLKNPDMFCPGP
jgi:hypothetical protein